MDTIRVFYDYQTLYTQTFGGISRYFYELIRAFHESEMIDARIFCRYSLNAYFDDFDGIKQTKAFSGIKLTPVRKTFRLYGHIINKAKIISAVRTDGCDILHPTYYDTYLLRQKGVKKVITVYDMIHELLMDQKAEAKTISQKKAWIYGADHIIAISENTKKDILRVYNDVDEKKISVIYIGSRFQEIVGSDSVDLPDEYILFVGRRGGYKNFDFFFQSISALLRSDHCLRLVCAGGGPFSDAERSMIGDLGDQVLRFDFSDEQLRTAYEKARCFVFPSRYEGFGIPVLEAFASGCPAALSRCSSLPEVGGDAALYFDPDDREELSSAVERLLRDESVREELRKKGYEQMNKFSWDEAARQTAACYRKVMGES